MAERRGRITEYNATNRQGKIKPDDNGPEALFYLRSVANADSEPRANDIVVFDSPEPRKNKKGKLVQENATSVTIEQRAPEPSAEEKQRAEKRKNDELRRIRARIEGSDPRGKRSEKRGRGSRDGGRGDRRSGDRRPGDRPAGERREGRAGERFSRPRRGDSGEPGSSEARTNQRRGERAGARGSRNDRRTPRTSKAGGSGIARDAKGRIRDKDRRSSSGSSATRIQLPLGRDIPAQAISIEFSNPSLVFEKYIQWPRELPPLGPKRIAVVDGAGSTIKNDEASPLEPTQSAVAEVSVQELPETESSPVEPVNQDTTNNEIEPLNTDSTLAKAEPRAPKTTQWKFLPRHKRYFLGKTLAQLYRNYERRGLPWSAVRSRREAMLRSLDYSGYTVVSEVIKGPWRFGVTNSPMTVFADAPMYFDRSFGFPVIPSANLKSTLEQYAKSIGGELLSALEAVDDLIILDAVPTSKLGQFTIEQANCYELEWDQTGQLIRPQSREAYIVATGEDAAFSFSIAVKDTCADRKNSKLILDGLKTAVTLAKNTYCVPGISSPTERKTGDAVIF